MRTLRNIVFLLLAGMTASIYAQKICLQGKTINEQKQPIPNATVTLIAIADSKIVGQTATTEKGLFEICANQQGIFQLRITTIGYENHEMDVILNKDVNIGAITLKEDIITLKGVTVTRSKIIQKVDRQIILPTQQQVERSMNGLDLFQKMNEFHIRVNLPRQEITYANGAGVEIRMNGISSSTQEITALLPEQIVKVEYYEHGNAKFKTNGAVLNFIVKHSEGGGSASVSLLNAVHTGFGNDRASLKLNHKKSEFAIDYFLSYEHYKDRWIDENMIYRLNEGIFTQMKKGEKVPYEDINHTVGLSYNLMDSANYMLNIRAGIPIRKHDNSFANQKTFLEHPDTLIHSESKNRNNSLSPSLDLYFIKYLPKEQTFAANVVGTYMNTDYSRRYHENSEEQLVAQFDEGIKGQKYSVIGEAYYEKGWEKYQLGAGATHKYESVNNEYTESDLPDYKMKHSYSYVYTTFSGRIDKIGFNVELSGEYSKFDNYNNNRYSFFNFTPKIGTSYNFNEDSHLYFNLGTKTTNPTLGSLNNVSQSIDYFTVQKGNPELNPYRSYYVSFSGRFQKNIFSVTGSLEYNYSHKPIMGSTFLENDKVVYQQQNQKFMRQTEAWVDFRLSLFDESLELYWSSALEHSSMGGNTYRYKRTYFLTGCNIDYYYKNWDFSFAAYTREKSLYGETISRGMYDQSISVGYKLNNFYFKAGALTPFLGKWSAGTEYLSPIASGKSWTYMGAASPMFYLNFSWNITWGKKYKSDSKALNNIDSDNGVLHIKNK